MGCGSSKPVTKKEGKPESKKEEDVGTQLGKEIGNLFAIGLKECVGILKNKDLADEEKSKQMEELKESYIQKYVEIGKKIRGLKPEEVSTVETVAGLSVLDLDESLHGEYMEYWMEVDGAEEFNTITQYSFFDLLKKQNPEEAERLGI